MTDLTRRCLGGVRFARSRGCTLLATSPRRQRSESWCKHPGPSYSTICNRVPVSWHTRPGPGVGALLWGTVTELGAQQNKLILLPGFTGTK